MGTDRPDSAAPAEHGAGKPTTGDKVPDLSELPALAVSLDKQAWSRKINNGTGSLLVTLSLTGTVTAKFGKPGEPTSPATSDDDQSPGSASSAGVPHEKSTVATPGEEALAERAPQNPKLTAETAVHYKPPDTLEVTGELSVKESVRTRLGTCELEGTPGFDLELTAKPRQSEPPPKNAGELIHLCSQILEGTTSPFTLTSGTASSKSRRPLFRVAALAVLLLALIVWLVQFETQPAQTSPAPTTTQSPDTTAPPTGDTQSSDTTAPPTGDTQSSDTTATTTSTTQSSDTTATTASTTIPSGTQPPGAAVVGGSTG
jgi:hypothetical protein